MKKIKKIVSIVLFVMMINVFSPLLMVVNASGTNIDELVSNLDRGISNIENKISLSKNDSLYNTDNAYASAVVTVSSDVSELSDEVKELKNSLSNVKLSDIARRTSNGVISTGYNNYINDCGSDYVVDMDNIQDVWCSALGDVNAKVVYISGSSLIDEINSIYISGLNSKITNYFNNYSTKFAGYKGDYNSYISTNFEAKVGVLNGYYTEVTNYISAENALGNSPDVVVNGNNIVSLLESAKEEVSSKNGVYNVNELDDVISELESIVSSSKDSRDLFFTNNKSYTELGIDSEIADLTGRYVSNYNDFDLWFTNAGLDIDVIDYGLLSSKIDNSFKVMVNDYVLLEDDYNSLIEKINNYLKRRPSDKGVIDDALVSLNDSYAKMNKDKVISLLEGIVNSASFTNLDVVDNLYFIRDYDVSDVVKKRLYDVKKSFYSLFINDYQNRVLDDSVILYGLKNVPNDLIRKIVYNATFTYNSEEYKLYTYDRARQLLSTYEVLLAGDVNNDKLINQQDVNMMHQLLVSSSLSDDLFVRCDLNNDKKFDVKDLVGLSNLVNEVNASDVEASFRVVKEVNDDTISYNVYLVSNGLVNGFSFDVNTSDDLVFNKMITGNNVLLKDSNNKLFIVGYGSFNNGDLLLSLTYDRENVSEYTTFKINNGILATDVDKSTDDVVVNDVIKNVVATEEDVVSTEEEVVSVGDDSNGKVIIYEDDSTSSDVSDDKSISVISDDINDKDDKISVKNLIKIVVVVLLGALIIYFLSKDDEDVLVEEKENKKD